MKKFLLLLIPGFAVSIMFAACGTNSGSSAPVVAALGSCTAGYVYSQYGCLSQGNCQVGYGSYNGTCIPGTVGSYGAYGAYGYGTGVGICSAGYVSTAYGCLPQGGCTANTGYYMGQCIPAATAGVTTMALPGGYPYGGYSGPTAPYAYGQQNRWW